MRVPEDSLDLMKEEVMSGNDKSTILSSYNGVILLGSKTLHYHHKYHIHTICYFFKCSMGAQGALSPQGVMTLPKIV